MVGVVGVGGHLLLRTHMPCLPTYALPIGPRDATRSTAAATEPASPNHIPWPKLPRENLAVWFTECAGVTVTCYYGVVSVHRCNRDLTVAHVAVTQ